MSLATITNLSASVALDVPAPFGVTLAPSGSKILGISYEDLTKGLERGTPAFHEIAKLINEGSMSLTIAPDGASRGPLEYGGSGPGSVVAYTPSTSADWPGADPNDVSEGLDKLAARTDATIYEFVKASADALAGDATAEFVFAEILRAGTILSARFIPTGTLTGDDTDYVTLSVAKRDGAGGAPAAVASVTSEDTGGTGDWAAFVAESLGAITNAAVIPGDLLTFAIAKAAAGKVVPVGVLRVVVEPASGA